MQNVECKMDRAKRIQQKQNRKKRAKEMTKIQGWDASGRYIGILAETPKPCSCIFCQPDKTKRKKLDEIILKELREVSDGCEGDS